MAESLMALSVLPAPSTPGARTLLPLAASQPMNAWLTLNAWLLLSSLAFWLLASLPVSLLASRLPAAWLEASWGERVAETIHSPSAPLQPPLGPRHPPGPTGVRVWKRWIPDASDALPGGVRKASLVRRASLSLGRLVNETRRAELVHWPRLPCGLLRAPGLPPAALVVNRLFGLAFNLLCLLRWNRRRLLRCLADWRPPAAGGEHNQPEPAWTPRSHPPGCRWRDPCSQELSAAPAPAAPAPPRPRPAPAAAPPRGSRPGAGAAAAGSCHHSAAAKR